MENLLQGFLHRTKYKSLSIIITIIIVFLALAGLISLFGDLGFGDEVIKYRWQIWLVLVVLSVIGVLIYDVVRNYRTISGLNNQIMAIKGQLDEAKLQEESLLRLMEKYKRAAYAEVLEHLNRLLILTSKRDEWQTNQARVTKVRVKPFSAAENIDPEFAHKERIDIIINIGQKAGVCEGMEFLVRDTQIPLDYGIISVSKVHSDGAVCILTEELDAGFWGQFNESIEKPVAKIYEVPDNRIVPNLPATFDSITPESADNLRTIISKIVFNRQVE
ncbi:MAG: hypothetical protein IMZ53_15800 [Thermoplasmata archaeon]|nr:hypothetical protein [Thermoplasmata archaeon]